MTLAGARDNLFDRSLMFLIAAVTVLYPVATFVIEGARTGNLVLLFLLSVIAFFFRRQQWREIKLQRTEKLLLFFFFLMFAVTLLSFFVYGDVDSAGQQRVEKYGGFLLSIPVYFLFRLYMPPAKIIWGGVVIACYVVLVRALLEVNGYVEDIAYAHFPHDRANGTMHPIRFGDLTLLLGFFSLAGSLYIRDVKVWLRIIGVLAFACGLFASVLSQSRGGWVAVPALLIIVFWPLFRELGFKNKIALIVIVIGSAVVLYQVPALKIQERFQEAVSDIVKYTEDGDSDTSVGARFDMYGAAYQMFVKNPWFGVGVGQYKSQALIYYRETKEKEKISVDVVLWGNPHNEILLHMATRGVVGLFVVLGLFVVGIVFFVRHVRKYDGDTQFYAVSGLMIFVAYLHFGMSISLFMHRDFTMFFVLYVLLFASGVNRRNRETT